MAKTGDRTRSEDAALVVEGGRVRAIGDWTVGHLHRLERSLGRIRWPEGDRIALDASGTTALDMAGAWLLRRTVADLEGRGRTVSLDGLGENERRVLDLVTPAEDGGPAAEGRPRRTGLLEGVGRSAAGLPREVFVFLSFLGELALAAARAVVRPHRIRWTATFHALEAAGPRALPIVGLLTFLLGVVIAYQGGVALASYGATPFVADLVGISLMRELAPLITAIIVAGRTGSAYAAQIGTMVITEEVDALRTMSIAPMDQLVLPRLFALLVALPLLTVFADVLGILGGMVMASGAFGLSFETFLGRLDTELAFRAFVLGMVKTPVFAAIIAAVGCHQGFSVTGSAESVGRRTTVSVVQSIFLVIVVDAAFSVAFSYAGL